MAPSAQGARGESVIQHGDTEYRLLFTNRALAEAESATGKSIIMIAQGFSVGTTGIGDVAHLLAVGMEAARRDAKSGGRTVTLVDAYRVMDEVGFTAAARVVMEAVAEVMQFSDEAEGESPNS